MRDLTENVLVLNPDELGQDPTTGMDLAVQLGISHLEIRSAYGRNAILLDDPEVKKIRCEADCRGLSIAALASPLFKWCLEDATPGRVDTFGFPARIDRQSRPRYIVRAIEIAALLGTSRVRIFSNLRVEPGLTEPLISDPMLPAALWWAGQCGVQLLVENEPVCTAARATTLVKLLETFASDGLGLWLDVANLHEVGEANPDLISQLTHHVGYVHIKDFRLTPSGREFCPAGTGDVPYKDALAAIQQVNSALPYALETHVRDIPAAAITEGARYLRTVVKGRW